MFVWSFVVSSAFSECACGWDGITTFETHNLEPEARDAPPRNQEYDFEAFELSSHATPERKMMSRNHLMEADPEMVDRREAMKHANLPSGLSVEEAPELERESFGI